MKILFAFSIAFLFISASYSLLKVILDNSLNEKDRAGWFVSSAFICMVIWLLFVGGKAVEREHQSQVITEISANE